MIQSYVPGSDILVSEMIRRDVPVGVPLDLFTPVPKYNGIQVSQLIYEMITGVRRR